MMTHLHLAQENSIRTFTFAMRNKEQKKRENKIFEKKKTQKTKKNKKTEKQKREEKWKKEKQRKKGETRKNM